MRIIFVFLFSLVFFHTCLTASIDRDSLRDEVEKPNEKQHVNVDGFNEDFLYPMFDESNLQDIIDHTNNPRISGFVKKQLFGVKYQNYSFYRKGFNVQMFQFPPNSYEYSSPKSYNIYEQDLFLDTIKTFGKLIKKIGICNPSDLANDDLVATYRSLNEYCSDSLNSLSLEDITENSFAELTKPFTSLEELSLYIPTQKVEIDLPFNEIFPKIKQLSLAFYYAGATEEEIGINEFISIELPHLQILTIDISFSNRSHLATVNKHLEMLLQKNPQIQKITIDLSSNEFIETINKYLPNLDHLSFLNVDTEFQPARLDHVKHFSSIIYDPCAINRLTFPKLESIDMVYLWWNKTRDPWVEFLKNHQQLKKIKCTVYNSNGLADFLKKLPLIDEIAIETFSGFNGDLISRFLGDHEFLSKLQYHVFARNDRDVPASYQQKFGNEWHITIDDDEINETTKLTFERMKSTP